MTAKFKQCIPDMLLYLYILYMYCLWKSNYQEERFGIPLTGLTCHSFVPFESQGMDSNAIHYTPETKSRVIIFSQSVLITLTPSSKGSMFIIWRAQVQYNGRMNNQDVNKDNNFINDSSVHYVIRTIVKKMKS
jgi:hypothetical protein